MRYRRVLSLLIGAVIDTKNVTIKVRDGATEFVEVKLGAGNFTWDEKVNREYVKDRGLLDTVRNGDEEPMDVRLDSQFEYITAASGATVPTVEDALKQRGPAADWVSTSSDPCEPYAVDIELTNAPPCGTNSQEVMIFPDFRYESANHDIKGGTISFSGKCNATEPTVTHGTVTT